MNLKSDLRKKLKAGLRREDQRSGIDQSISQSFLHWWNFFGLRPDGQRKMLGVYIPQMDEVKWDQNFSKEDFGDLAIPLFESGDSGLQPSFFRLEYSELRDRVFTFGIDKKKAQEREQVVPEVVLVPGMAFGQSGARLGRGLGYYDRLLKPLKGIKIALCYDSQIIPDLPEEDHDQKVDFVLTESTVFLSSLNFSLNEVVHGN